jgi:hypothetical protein
MTLVSASAIDDPRTELPFVKGLVNYCEDVPRAWYYVGDTSKNYQPLDPREVTIKDARPIVDQLDLDQHGFTLRPHHCSVSHLRTPEELDEAYHNELIDVVKEVTGADRVLPYRRYLQVRLSQRAPGENGDETTRPAGFVHMDITSETFGNWARWTQEEEGLPLKPYNRAALIQTWRAVSDPPQDFSLALTNGRSVKPGKYVVMDNYTTLEGEGQIVQTRLGVYDPDDDWYYFPNMHADEVLLFKGYDTRWGDTLNVLHTGFDNTRTYPNAIPRESIEARFIAYWD